MNLKSEWDKETIRERERERERERTDRQRQIKWEKERKKTKREKRQRKIRIKIDKQYWWKKGRISRDLIRESKERYISERGEDRLRGT